MELSDGIKKFFLLGVGAAATSVEKSTEIMDELVKKGELTVEQGKAFNQELKHNIRETSDKAKAAPEEKTAEKKDFNDLVSGLSEEDLAKLKEAIAKKEKA